MPVTDMVNTCTCN